MTDFERRDARAKVRTYMKDGEEKTVYATIGSAEVSEHASVIKVYIDCLPLNFDGRIYINKPYEKKEEPKDDNQLTHEFNQKVTQDNLPTDEDMEKPIQLSEIPF